MESALHTAVNGHDSDPYPEQLIPGAGQAVPSLSSEPGTLSGQPPAMPAPALPASDLPVLGAPPLALLAPTSVCPALPIEVPSPRDLPPQATARSTHKTQPRLFKTP